MQKTIFKISKMDCPSEEQMIRLKLLDLSNIKSLKQKSTTIAVLSIV
jgi:hypothetical protein